MKKRYWDMLDNYEDFVDELLKEVVEFSTNNSILSDLINSTDDCLSELDIRNTIVKLRDLKIDNLLDEE